MQLAKATRTFLPADFKLTDWASLKPYFEHLAERPLNNPDQLLQWLRDRSELESLLEEDMGWRYIKMTCDTANQQHAEAFNFFVTEIEPQIAPFADAFNRKYHDSQYRTALNQDPGIALHEKSIASAIEIYREENIELLTKIQQLQQQYAAIAGAMSVVVDGHEMTMQQAGTKLQEPDRLVRQTVWTNLQERRLQDKDQLNTLFTDLIRLRHQVALNAGFKNFRDYMFVSMNRYDYTPADCFAFHEAVAQAVVPLETTFAEKRQATMQLESLRPWDLSVDPEGRPAQQAFKDSKDLLDKTIAAFKNIRPELADYISTMDELGHLDLDSRKGKAPGGYNYPLDETGVPFIFMHATGTVRDLVTMVHEGGHAVHSFVTRDLPFNFYKHCPSEVAELASMSMELLSMDQWHHFFPDEEECKRAKREHLEQILDTLPWVACIDAYQHWLYENPDHTVEERENYWIENHKRFSPGTVNWSGLEKYRRIMWQKQLHLYEVPFYYIEYGMAQLGAVAVWKNYKENPQKAVDQYLDALKLGNTRSIKEIYAAGGIKFDFSAAYISELMAFVQQQLAAL